MTDDAFPRSSRPSPPHGQDAADRREPASDPLMELARLIGQSDPFGTAARDAAPMRRARPNCRPAARWRGRLRAPILRAQSAQEEKPRYEEEPRDEEEPPEPRPARGHPFPWLQVPPAPAPRPVRPRALPSDRSHEQARETAYREAAYREPPPYSEPPLTAAPRRIPLTRSRRPVGMSATSRASALPNRRASSPATRRANIRRAAGPAICRSNVYAAETEPAHAGSLSSPRRPPAPAAYARMASTANAASMTGHAPRA